MIEPKFRECIVRLKCQSWVLRFWINTTSTLTPSETGEHLFRLRNFIDALPPGNGLKQVENMVMAHFLPEHSIAAYEILSCAHGAGIVGYVEWP
jgi:hypothetical protein